MVNWKCGWVSILQNPASTRKSVCLQTWCWHIIDSSPLFFTSFAWYDPLQGRTSDPLILCPAKLYVGMRDIRVALVWALRWQVKHLSKHICPWMRPVPKAHQSTKRFQHNSPQTMYLALHLYPSTVWFQDGLYLSHLQKLTKLGIATTKHVFLHLVNSPVVDWELIWHNLSTWDCSTTVDISLSPKFTSISR